MHKIGVFGGTFDPIHYGHIHLAEQALNECRLDKLLVVPAAIQPFKPKQEMALGDHRLHMAKIAFTTDDKISVSDIELKKNSISYTIDTLREIRESYGQETEIFFILGTDAFLKIEKWKNADELVKGYSFIVGARPGYRQDELDEFAGRLRSVYNNSIMKISNRQINISSTEIKQAIRSGKDLSGYFPKEVERYIISNGLYRELY